MGIVNKRTQAHVCERACKTFYTKTPLALQARILCNLQQSILCLHLKHGILT